MWNISYITSAFNLLNIKINAANSKIIEQNFDSIIIEGEKPSDEEKDEDEIEDSEIDENNDWYIINKIRIPSVYGKNNSFYSEYDYKKRIEREQSKIW